MKKPVLVLSIVAFSASGCSIQDRVTKIEAEQVTQNARLDTLESMPGGSTPIVPKGAIVMWNEDTAPTGWCILDGSDSRCPTPNLKGLFIMAGGTADDKNKRGGPFPKVDQVSPPATFQTKPEPNHVHELFYDDGVTGPKNGLYYLKEESVKEHFNPIYRDNPKGGHEHTVEFESVPHYKLIFIQKL